MKQKTKERMMEKKKVVKTLFVRGVARIMNQQKEIKGLITEEKSRRRRKSLCVGDWVELLEDVKFPASERDPIPGTSFYCTGKILLVKPRYDIRYPFCVRWENGQYNDYSRAHLKKIFGNLLEYLKEDLAESQKELAEMNVAEAKRVEKNRIKEQLKTEAIKRKKETKELRLRIQEMKKRVCREKKMARARMAKEKAKEKKKNKAVLPQISKTEAI